MDQNFLIYKLWGNQATVTFFFVWIGEVERLATKAKVRLGLSAMFVVWPMNCGPKLPLHGAMIQLGGVIVDHAWGGGTNWWDRSDWLKKGQARFTLRGLASSPVSRTSLSTLHLSMGMEHHDYGIVSRFMVRPPYIYTVKYCVVSSAERFKV